MMLLWMEKISIIWRCFLFLILESTTGNISWGNGQQSLIKQIMRRNQEDNPCQLTQPTTIPKNKKPVPREYSNEFLYTSLTKSLKFLNSRLVLEILEKSFNFNENFGRPLKNLWIYQLSLRSSNLEYSMIYWVLFPDWCHFMVSSHGVAIKFWHLWISYRGTWNILELSLNFVKGILWSPWQILALFGVMAEEVGCHNFFSSQSCFSRSISYKLITGLEDSFLSLLKSWEQLSALSNSGRSMIP